MSIQLIEDEIRRSLATTEPEVICIKGHWGVGKTFAWNKYLEQARKDGHIGLKHYAYVSLFGITSLEELKYAIFENTVGTTGIGVEPSLQTFQSHTTEVAKQLGKKFLPILQQLPFTRSYAGSVAPALWFMAVKETIVCVDDIERRGEKLSMRDVLGLVSNLKERRRCKIILILNDDAEDRENDQFRTYFEKVVDNKSMNFAPTAAECVQIALSSENATSKLLRESCITLGISNIRILRRVEYFIEKVSPLLKEFDEEVMWQAVKSIVLLGWCVYEPKKAPPIEFLEKRLAIRFGLEGKKTLTEREAAWSALLDVYKFSSLDEFDLSLHDGIKNGYFDPDLVKRHATPLDEQSKAGKSDSIVHDAWSLYHDSFDDNENEVADAIFEANFKNIWNVSPINLNGAVVLLKELGRPQQAHKLIEHYMASRKETPRGFFDLDENLHGGDIKDEDVRKAFREKLLSFNDDREPSSILHSISKNNGWHPDDIKILAEVPVDTYYTMFKTHRGAIRDALLDACLQFDRITGVDEQTKEIPRRAKEALLRIGKESRLNARRVRKYGVIVPSPDPSLDSQGGETG